MRESIGKRPKNSGNRSRRKKRRNLVGNYLGSLQQNYYMDGERKDIREKEKRDKMKIGVDRKILQSKKT